MENISILRIHKLDSEGSYKAYVDLRIGCVEIRGARIVEGKNGLFVSLPKKMGKDEKWYDIVKIDSKSVFTKLTETVLEEYNK